MISSTSHDKILFAHWVIFFNKFLSISTPGYVFIYLSGSFLIENHHFDQDWTFCSIEPFKNSDLLEVVIIHTRS